jgi:hypothetical protein
MNQVAALCEIIKVWTYDSDLKARVRMRRPGFIEPKREGPWDFATVVFPRGKAMRLDMRPGQQLWVSGVLTSRDEDVPLVEVLEGVEIPEGLKERRIRFNFNEIIALSWQVME